jgi:hypothetical protein
MITVRGRNVNLYVSRSTEYVLAICATNLSRRQNVGTLTTLVRGAGNFRRFKPTIKEEQLTLEGLRTIDTPTQFQIHEFEIGSFYVVRIIYDDLSGNTIQLDGEVLVTSIDDNNGSADFSTWAVGMVKNGEWAVSGTGAADATAPVVTRARAINSNTVRVTFNKGVVATVTGWTVSIESVDTTITAVSGGGSVWDFTTLAAMSPGDELLLNYDLFTGNTLSLSGVEHDNLVDFPIENLIVTAGTFIGYFGSSNSVIFPAIPLGDLVPQITGTFASGGPMTFNIAGVPDNRWMFFKEPISEPVKTNWFNTAFNNGTFPDSVFNAPQELDGFRYYTSRNRLSMDTTQSLTAS